jgi:hypothetical protein
MRSGRKRRKFKFILIYAAIIIALFSIWFVLREKNKINPPAENTITINNENGNLPAQAELTPSFAETLDLKKPPPPPVSMDKVKTQGCVADGLLTGYNPQNEEFISLINRSKCYYLHRAIETWLSPPDFEKIQGVMDRIIKPDIVYGMFIAEAISFEDNYKNEETGHTFEFRKMCHDNTMNQWGEHTCVPTFSSPEYRAYIQYITHKAIDMGVQSFTFGQIYMQESSTRDYAPQIVKDIRAYAKKKDVDVIIGAQTGSITDSKYLKLFDYIEGGVGLDESGQIEGGPCLSRKESCWALLWHKNFSSKAKNVLLHLDWTGLTYDDLDIFARMNAVKRAETLQNLYGFFTSQKMGFLMPYFGVLNKNNGGCFGPKKGFYSPDDAYSCKDEKAINKILTEKKSSSIFSEKLPSNSSF